MGLNVLLPLFCRAETSTYAPEFAGNLDQWLSSVYDWSIGIGGALAVAVVIWSGFDYVTSAGDTEKINKAKENMMGAIVAFILLLAAAIILKALGSAQVS